ncbi:hypothetical protein AcW1_002080 [Taiwanofungus camphoratus]|nr:hypothetical protein AcW1_002080 [Antrodia cinnamomea]
MDTLAAQHPSQHHLPVDAASYSHSLSVPTSAQSSPHAYHQQLAYPSSSEPAPSFQQQYEQQHARGASLQIATGTAAPHGHEPEEETAHPLRATTQHPLQHPSEAQGDDETAQPSIVDSITRGTGGPYGGLSRLLTHQEREMLNHLDRLKFFLATAPSRWSADGAGMASTSDPSALPVGHPNSAHPALNRFLLPNSEYVSCVLWGGLYHITGTDIVRALVFRFEAFGRPVKNMKKFEEGVFSDLRNLKPGIDACLEEPKSPFLDLLFKYQCIRTQKKQKVFYWFSVPHDRLFLDALERDLKREKMGMEPTTVVTGEPALSFTYDSKRSLYEQFSKAHGTAEGEGELEAAVRRADEAMSSDGDQSGENARDHASDAELSSDEVSASNPEDHPVSKQPGMNKAPAALSGPSSPFFSMFSLFEGSPTYKQRRKKVNKGRKSPSSFAPVHAGEVSMDEYGRVHAARAPEPQVDRFGRDVTRMSAAEMFMAQARGDFGAQSNPDLVASQKERQRLAMEAQVHEFSGAAGRQSRASYHDGLVGPGMSGRAADVQGMIPPSAASQYPAPLNLHPSLMLQGTNSANSAIPMGQQEYQEQVQDRQRPHVDQRHTYPMMNYGQDQMRSSTQPFPDEGVPMHNDWSPHVQSAPVGMPPMRSKAYVCPLFSCGRMFKRMEHLKRHLRTHTLERPYQCLRCKKRFSRSDNLNQHLRTHMRTGHDGSLDMMEDEGGNADADSEEVDELAGDTDGFDGSLGYISGMVSMPNVQMCEVEVQGQVHDVQGDEEGLVTTTGAVNPAVPTSAMADGSDDRQDVYYNESVAHMVRSSPEQSPYMPANASPDVQWATIRPHSSMSYTASSLPSHQMRMSPSYNPNVGEFVTSISAPSHKATFDHSSLYPSGLDVNGPGPIRRHRSATPSISKYGETIRRPFSAAISDHGGAPASNRSYHPYPVPSHHQVHSADSSPMAYTVPLGYNTHNTSAPPSRQGSHSRSSSSGQLQAQMQQMMSLEQMDADNVAYPQDVVAAPQAAFSTIYRSDSPMQYATAPGSYELELAHPEDGNQQIPVHEMYALDMPDSQVHYGSQPLAAAAGYYSTLTHGDPHQVSM